MNATTAQSRKAWYAIVCGWGIAAIGVWIWSTGYGFSTYEVSENLGHNQWPQETSLKLAVDRPTLVFFIHPRCPCTRASIRELEEILTGQGLPAQQQPKLIVVSTLPSNASEEWRDTDTVSHVARLPHVSLAWDEEGVESNRFGASVSGTVMLYVPSGKRLFAGGVTASRGHEGDNAGSDRVRRILIDREQSPQETTPAFGCKLCIATSRTNPDTANDVDP